MFSCKGLGDGLIALILAHNLREKGQEAVLFHPFLSGLQRWFPKTPIRAFPQLEELAQFDRFYIVYEKSAWMSGILAHCKAHFPDRTFVLNPIATPKRDYPYWAVGQFDGTLPFAMNLAKFCARHLQTESSTMANGILIPAEYTLRKHPQRVVIHPTSSRPGKNWPEEKFIALAEQLERHGYEPVFILTQEERAGWPLLNFSAPDFPSLDAAASFVCESGAMIGNDSGIGHLASCLGLPTVTICRSRMTGQFWRPAWSPGAILYPPAWLPNLKGLRLRDRYWKQTISVRRVLRSFLSLDTTR